MIGHDRERRPTPGRPSPGHGRPAIPDGMGAVSSRVEGSQWSTAASRGRRESEPGRVPRGLPASPAPAGRAMASTSPAGHDRAPLFRESQKRLRSAWDRGATLVP
jgi:hypothetical protein